MSGTKWTKEEDDLLKQFKSHRLPDKEIASQLNRTSSAIGSRVTFLGLRNRPAAIPPHLLSEPLQLRIFLWENRIFPKLVKTDTGCMEWREKQVTYFGYGRITITTGKILTTHRVSLEVSLGRLLESGEQSLHKCDNPRCNNPEHLFLGSQKDNIDDKWNKGRANHLVGEQCPYSVLTEKIVHQLRSEYVPFKVSFRILAKKYKLTETAVRKAITKKTWKHI